MRSVDRLQTVLTRIVNENVDNNNEFFYQKIMFCMGRLSRLFIDNACPVVRNGAIVAGNFWTDFVPNENFPTLTIEVEYAKLSKFIDEEKDETQHLYARAVRLMTRKFDPISPDYNIDIFPLFVDYLVRIGCYKEDVAEIIEICF